MLSSTFLGIVPIIFGLGFASVSEVPKQEVINGGNLLGTYCFRNTFDIDYYNVEEDYLYSFIFNRNQVSGLKECPIMLCSGVTFDVRQHYYVTDLTIEYYNTGVNTYWDISVTYSGETGYETGTFSTRFYLGEDITEGDSDLTDILIYFPNYVFLNGDNLKVFNSVFTTEGNRFNTYYNGYYSITNSSYNSFWQLYGSICVNNSLFDYMYYTHYDNAPYSVSACQLLTSDNADYMFIYNNTFVEYRYTSPNILISGTLIPNVYVERMTQMGVFAYQYDNTHYEFQDVVTSVIDGPIYMLSQLFSFELFGVQFYVAFMSIVTVVLICFVIKKIV